MRTRDFDFHLPQELIAQHPSPSRDGSRLLVLDSAAGRLEDRRFKELVEILPPESLMVLNDSRVFPARLRGRKPTGGAVEVLLVSPAPLDLPPSGEHPPGGRIWRCLCRSSKGLSPGGLVLLGDRGADDRGSDPEVLARVLRVLPEGGADLLFWRPGHQIDGDSQVDGDSQGSGDWLVGWASLHGEIPLPPYIRRPDGELEQDRERYQTVFARETGSVAAPTAGLHFTGSLLDRIRARGIELAHLTLHVGPGTFRPVRVEQVSKHRMDAERVEISPALARAVREAHAAGRPVVAVGTTSVRGLEGMALGPGELRTGTEEISIFITPGHQFQVVDKLITNFHLPRSTLLMLVSALAGTDRVLEAYRHAVSKGYRFYSYGDAMLIK